MWICGIDKSKGLLNEIGARRKKKEFSQQQIGAVNNIKWGMQTTATGFIPLEKVTHW